MALSTSQSIWSSYKPAVTDKKMFLLTMFDTYLREKTKACVAGTRRGGWSPVVVLSLLCLALLPYDVKAGTVSVNNGVTTSVATTTQSLNNSGIHEYYRCMYCHKAEHIIDCLEVITCAPHEVCYVEKEMLQSGWPVINAGCRSRHACNLKTCFGESMHGYSHSKKRSTLSCHHCCEGEFCNLYGCPDSEDMAVLPSTRCLGCDAVKDPVYCDKLINCPYSQQCVAYGVFHAGGLRFELGCEEKTYCNAFKNNSKVSRDVTHHVGEIDLASTCCDTHLCNRNWPVRDQPPPKVISGFTCNQQTQRPTSFTTQTSTPSSLVSNTSQTSPDNTTTLPTAANVTIPTSENCKDRATESSCIFLNQTNHICDSISLTSVYYCVKFCGFCSPLPTRPGIQGQTTPIAVTTTTTTFPPVPTRSGIQGQTTPIVGTLTTSTFPSLPTRSGIQGQKTTPIAARTGLTFSSQNAPVLGKRQSEYSDDDTDGQGQQSTNHH